MNKLSFSLLNFYFSSSLPVDDILIGHYITTGNALAVSLAVSIVVEAWVEFLFQDRVIELFFKKI